MKQLLIPVLIGTLSAIGLVSCQREVEGILDNGPKIDPSNPQSISASIKVWHGERTAGKAPLPGSNPARPVIDPFSNGQQIHAIAGRYAIIEPEVVSGNLAGYYVSVTGANEHFKVAYSKPRLTERPRRFNHVRTQYQNKPFGMDSAGAGNGILDSAIVIQIPANIQPGSFCITYCAYDSAGNVSDSIGACITVTQFGGDASTSYLTGKWKASAIKEDTSTQWQPWDYSPEIRIDTLYCEPDPVVGYGFTDYCYTGFCPNYFVDTIYNDQNIKTDFTFSDNGGFRYDEQWIYKEYARFGTTCGNAGLDGGLESDIFDGAWSYNSTTHKIILVLDFDAYGFPDPEAYEFILTKDSDQQITFIDSDNYGYRFVKY
jgi:hypothetical protein